MTDAIEDKPPVPSRRQRRSRADVAWSHAMLGERTIQLGSRGDDVSNLQGVLAGRHNVLGLQADGVFGVKTQEALSDFQKTAGIEPSGVVDAETLKALGF